MGNKIDDDQGQLLAKVKKFLNSLGTTGYPEHDYVWIDFSCVPQDDQELRISHLLAIPDILRRSHVQAFHISPDEHAAYQNSVWCQLETIALSSRSSSKYIPNRTWTILDKNDLYAVLPGFLEMVRFQSLKFLIEN
jgi:hypothetical protein